MATTGVDLSNPDFSGYLFKQSTWFKEWRQRWFVLKGSKLYFCKAPNMEPHGVIDLKECISVKTADMVTRKTNSFEVKTPEAVYYMYAEKHKTKDEWIGAISRAIVRYSSAYITEDDD
jgi:hypothetical protein